jgi:hypothetical protein
MIEPSKIKSISKKLKILASERSPSAPQYLQALKLEDALFANRVLTAIRDKRILQISVNEDLKLVDAFFKMTGLANDDRLLQVIYPVDGVDFNEAIGLFDLWIIKLQPEAQLKRKYRSMF